MKAIATTLLAGLLAVAIPTGAQTPAAPNPDFALVQKHLDPGGKMYFYLDADTFFASIADVLADYAEVFSKSARPEDRTELQAGINGFRRGYPAAGLHAIQGFGASSIPDSTSGLFINRHFLHLSPGPTGIPFLLAAEPRKRATLNFAPSNTTWYYSFDAKPGEWLKLAETIGEKTDGARGKAKVEMALSMMDVGVKMPVRSMLSSINGEIALIASFDPKVTIEIESAPEDDTPAIIPRPDLFLVIETPEPLLRDTILQAVKKEGVETEQVESEGLTMTVLKTKEYYKGLTPTIAHDGKYFYFSTTTGELTAAIARMKKGAGGLADVEEFKTLTAGFPAETNSLAFTSERMLGVMQQVIGSSLPADEERAELDRLLASVGPLYGVQRHAKYSRAVPDGIEWYARESRDGRMLAAQAGVVPAAVVAAIAVPSFLRAREISRRNACQENLFKIDAAKQQWALENNKPASAIPTWDDLVGSDKFLRTSPVCPGDGVYTINTIDQDPSCSLSESPDFAHVFPRAEVQQ